MTLAKLPPEAARMVAGLDANHRALVRARKLRSRFFRPLPHPPTFRDAPTAIAWLMDPWRDVQRAAERHFHAAVFPRLLAKERRRAGL